MGAPDGFVGDEFVFDARPSYPLLIKAKRYTPASSLNVGEAHGSNAHDKGVTLILAHCTGGHKENWEPTLSDLWTVISTKKDFPIREIWSIDCPNHGEAAVLNEQTLKWGYDFVYPWEDYGRAIHLFLTGHGSGIPDDYFREHKLIGIGHSMGATALLITQMLLNPPTWVSLILVEPILLSVEAEIKLNKNSPDNAALSRRDIWPSRQVAFETLSKRKSFKSWNLRALKIFCEDGLRDLPTAEYPDETNGVTLKCTKRQEAACYRDSIGRIRAYNFLKYACIQMPVHAIFGTISDFTMEGVREDVIENAAQGKLASVQMIQSSGHLVVQMSPDGLASALYNVLMHNETMGTPSRTEKSRL